MSRPAAVSAGCKLPKSADRQAVKTISRRDMEIFIVNFLDRVPRWHSMRPDFDSRLIAWPAAINGHQQVLTNGSRPDFLLTRWIPFRVLQTLAEPLRPIKPASPLKWWWELKKQSNGIAAAYVIAWLFS